MPKNTTAIDYEIDDAGALNLCKAILSKAASDYRAYRSNGFEEKAKEITDWLRDELGDAICLGNGNYIASKLERERYGRK